MEFVEQVVYGIDFDTTLKLALRMNKSAEETLQYQTFAEVLDQITDTISKETTLEPATVVEDDGDGAPEAGPPPAAAGSCGTTTAAEDGSGDCAVRRAAQRVVSAHVKLIAELATEQQLVDAGLDYVGILIDGNLLAESITAPHIRKPPVNKDMARVSNIRHRNTAM